MSENVLGFDTATRATAVALALDDGEAIEARDDPAPGHRPAHAGKLLPLAVELLDRAGIGWQDLDRLAVGTGPGTFTGLRIGITTARSLAHALGIPLAGISTLEALASPACREGEEAQTVLAAIDARRGEVFTAAWSVGGGQLMAPAAVAPDVLAGQVRALPAPVLAVGDGAVAFRDILEASGAVVPPGPSQLHRVTAIEHCRLARGVADADPDEVQPQYIRLPDAEITRRAQANR